MGFLDSFKEISATVKETTSAAKDVYDYLGTVVNIPAIKIGQPAKGNQTAEQIQNGQFGGQPGVPASNQPASATMNANPGAVAGMGSLMPYLPFAIVGAGLFLLMGKRGKKG